MSVKHNLEQWVAQLDYDDTCDISDRQVSDLIRNYATLEARCAALAAENAGLKDAIETHKHGFVRCNCCGDELMCHTDDVCRALDDTPETDAFLAEVRAQGVEEFLRGSQLPYQIATVLADYDNVDDATLQTVIWSGQPPEPDGDVWHLEYVSRGNAIVRSLLKELRKGGV